MLVFDEVDAGIGGRTARVLTDKLRELAATAQVLCITHLPQIAAAADRHFLVEKTQGETSEAHVAELSPTRRSRSSCACSAPTRGTPTPARWRSACAAPRPPRNPFEGCPESVATRWRTHAHLLRSGLLAILLLATAVAAPRRRQPRPPLFQTGRYAALGTGGSLSFVVSRRRSRGCRCACRWPARTSARTRTRRRRSPSRLDGHGQREHLLPHLPPGRRRANVSFVVDDNARQPEIYLSLQLKGGLGHVSVHARSKAAREACEGALGFDVRVR